MNDIYSLLIKPNATHEKPIKGVATFGKYVRFNSRVEVYLIPSKSEYDDVKYYLWYDDEDYLYFRDEYMKYIGLR